MYWTCKNPKCGYDKNGGNDVVCQQCGWPRGKKRPPKSSIIIAVAVFVIIATVGSLFAAGILPLDDDKKQIEPDPPTPAPTSPTPVPTPTEPESGEDEEKDKAPTLKDLEAMAASGKANTKSNKNSYLVLPTEKQMLDQPFKAYTDNEKHSGSIYIMPKPESNHGYLGTVPVKTEVWIVAETDYYYFFATENGLIGWNGKSYFND